MTKVFYKHVGFFNGMDAVANNRLTADEVVENVRNCVGEFNASGDDYFYTYNRSHFDYPSDWDNEGKETSDGLYVVVFDKSIEKLYDCPKDNAEAQSEYAYVDVYRKIVLDYDDNFDFRRTYTEYGFDMAFVSDTLTPSYLADILLNFSDIKGVHFLHNCMVIKTKGYGKTLAELEAIKTNLHGVNMSVSGSSPYFKEVDDDSPSIYYNIFFTDNFSAIKHPKGL